MIRDAIITLVLKKSLTFEQASGAMEEIMTGKATPAQIAAFVTALNMKGETAEYIEHRADTDFPSGTGGILHGRVEGWSKHEPYTDLLDNFLNSLRLQAKV